MLSKFHRIIVPVLAIVAIVSVIGLVKTIKNNKTSEVKQSITGAGNNPVRSYYHTIGTASSPASLTASYAGNSTTLRVGFLENLHLDFKYTTGASGTNQYAMVLIEGSNDDGATFFPLSAKVVGTQEVDVYALDFNGAAGIPVVFPGTKTSATGTTYFGSTDFNLVADTIRISAKQNYDTTASGTLYIMTVVTNQ